METKEFNVPIPEGYEIDKENSTFECIKFKPKSLTYDDIAFKLFCEKQTFTIESDGEIFSFRCDKHIYMEENNSTSYKQCKKLLAINKLMNVAKYLNGDWKPNWNDTDEGKYGLYTANDNLVHTIRTAYLNDKLVHFQSEELALKAIEILGEETIKLALSTDW